MENKKTGFTLIETLIALNVIAISLLLLNSSLTVLNKTDRKMYKSLDEIGINQLRLLLALSKDLKADIDKLTFKYKNEEMKLKQYKDKLILTPGYQVFLGNINSVYFKTDTCVYLVYIRDGKQNERVLTCE